MNNVNDFFLSNRRLTIIYYTGWTAAFLVTLAIASGIALGTLKNYLSKQTVQVSEILNSPVRAAVHAFDQIAATSDRPRCDVQLLDAMRDVAFLPDGINEFLHLENGAIACSSSRGFLSTPIALGRPIIRSSDRLPIDVWMEVDLAGLGHPGQRGTVVAVGRFGAVLPKSSLPGEFPSWLALEGVVAAPSGAVIAYDGDAGLFARNRLALAQGATSTASGLVQNHCVVGELYCVAGAISVVGVMSDFVPWVILLLLFCALTAGFVAGKIRLLVTRYFNFGARFRRNLGAETILCHYQPIVDLETGLIVGCEVLARFRDLDGTVVYPDRFIPLVDADGRSMELTRLVIQKAYQELGSQMPEDCPLQVNFNIHPQDLGEPELPRLLAPFLAAPQRFGVAVEIVESEEISFAAAERSIAGLQHHGIRVYIDDFGTGYSNLENVARLPVDAVKLDKGFAMAPPTSVMAQMLSVAVQMAHAAGKAIVVEGVETAERLAHLVSMAVPVQFVQGYYLSRPVDIAGFRALLDQQPLVPMSFPEKLHAV